MPLILDENEKILEDRKKLFKILGSQSNTMGEKVWLKRRFKDYDIKKEDISELKLRMDIVPTSIAIAQAAKESGWGTSRFAKEGNALFGEWTYDNDNGLLPFEREAGQKHLIRSFDSIRSSVVAYMKNINSHNAYKIFRNKRAEYRNQNLPLNSRVLVHELSPYAELPNYTDILFDIIKINSLDEFDNVILLNEISLV